jgi:hypothetical protein
LLLEVGEIYFVRANVGKSSLPQKTILQGAAISYQVGIQNELGSSWKDANATTYIS